MESNKGMFIFTWFKTFIISSLNSFFLGCKSNGNKRGAKLILSGFPCSPLFSFSLQGSFLSSLFLEGWLVLAIKMGSHSKCTSVYDYYTLDKTYNDS